MRSLTDEFTRVKNASRKLVILPQTKVSKVLNSLADKIESEVPSLLEENQKDLVRMAKEDPKFDRLELNKDRLLAISNDIRNIASLPSPVGEIMEEKILENGLELKKIRVPFGVVGIVYEARPNVTFDVFALCIKSGNACILKGGSDAEYSNKKILELIRDVLEENQVDTEIVELLPPGRSSTEELINAVGYVDLIIPRGSQNLINFVRDNSKVPVIETGAGIVHTYFDKNGDLGKGSSIIFNAKTRRVSVCNALDCLILHEDRLSDLPILIHKLAETNVKIFADEHSRHALKGHYPDHLLDHASEEHFGTEFLDYKMSIVTVNGIEEALEHIYQYSSRHSEAIISEDQSVIDIFLNQVDAAVVYANASTAFTDGAQFGMGAEIGISTQKLHARGPMALREMTSYKWVVLGEGTIRT